MVLRILVALSAVTVIAVAQSDRGEQLYLSQCAYCHGREGEGGRGPALNRSVLRRAPDDEALRRVIRRGIAEAGMPATNLSDREAGQVAAWVRRLGRVVPASVPIGDAARGEALYAGEKARCASCHMIRGRGGAFGPDLSSIGLRRSPQYLRTSLTEPSADRPDGFVRVSAVVTRTGRKLDGARVNEDSFSIQVRDASGAVHSFWKSELTGLKKGDASSPMPAYGAAFSAQELDDIAAYLATLREEEAR